jgi:coat protein Gp5
MSVNNFIANVWAGTVLANLNKAQVFAQPGVVNNDYEGEISQFGDSVKITAIGPVTARAYTRNADMSGPDQPTDAGSVLVIDQANYINVAVDDVDAAQIRPNLMDAVGIEAAYALSNQQDIYIASLWNQIGTANQIGSSGSPKTDLATLGQAFAYLANLKQILDENNVPQDGRWCIIPPWYEAKLLLDTKFNNSLLVDMTRGVLLNGSVGRQVMGFMLLRSNNVQIPSATTYAVMAGWSGAITLAQQLLDVKAYSPEKRMADAIKMLLVYGAKLVRPNAVAVAFVQKA